jgi:urea transport system permease protein
VFTGVFPDEWLYALGLLFVLVTLFLPKGVIGVIDIIKAKKADKGDGDKGTPVETKEAEHA